MADKTEDQQPATPEEVVGHADGEVLEGSDGTEKVVFDYDEDKNFIGWHKEPVKG